MFRFTLLNEPSPSPPPSASAVPAVADRSTATPRVPTTLVSDRTGCIAPSLVAFDGGYRRRPERTQTREAAHWVPLLVFCRGAVAPSDSTTVETALTGCD